MEKNIRISAVVGIDPGKTGGDCCLASEPQNRGNKNAGRPYGVAAMV